MKIHVPENEYYEQKSGEHRCRVTRCPHVHAEQRDKHGEQVDEEMLALVLERPGANDPVIFLRRCDAPSAKKSAIGDDDTRNAESDEPSVRYFVAASNGPQHEQRGETSQHHEKSGEREAARPSRRHYSAISRAARHNCDYTADSTISKFALGETGAGALLLEWERNSGMSGRYKGRFTREALVALYRIAKPSIHPISS